jgi:hypothetical protein
VTKGEITFAGKNLLALDPPDRVRLGLAHVLQGRRVFVHQTPRENLLAATSMYHDRAHINTLIELKTFFSRVVPGPRTSGLRGGSETKISDNLPHKAGARGAKLAEAIRDALSRWAGLTPLPRRRPHRDRFQCGRT